MKCRTSTFHGFCAFILGQPEEPETVPDSHKVPEQSEEHPETINEQSDDDTVETTNNENIQNNKESEAENIDDAQIEEGKSSPINGEAEEEEQDNDEGETEVKRQSSGKSQQSEEEKSEPSSNHLKQPSVDRVSPEKLLEDDTEGEGVIEGKLHVVV